MSSNNSITEYGKDIIVGGLILIYIITDRGVPALINNASLSLYGLITLCMLVIVSFTFFHPMVGILAIALIFKLIVSNRNNRGKSSSVPDISNIPADFQPGSLEPQNVLTDDFNARIVSAQAPVTVRSIDNTLEQEVIANMVPLSTTSFSSSPSSHVNNNIQPILPKFDGSPIN